jgi:hypothetical protein
VATPIRDPYRYLLAAILHQALIDVRCRNRHRAAEAVAWLRECGVDVCAMLGYVIDDWRELL